MPPPLPGDRQLHRDRRPATGRTKSFPVLMRAGGDDAEAHSDVSGPRRRAVLPRGAGSLEGSKSWCDRCSPADGPRADGFGCPRPMRIAVGLGSGQLPLLVIALCHTRLTEDTPHVDDQVDAVLGCRARSGATARGDDRHGHRTASVRSTDSRHPPRGTGLPPLHRFRTRSRTGLIACRSAGRPPVSRHRSVPSVGRSPLSRAPVSACARTAASTSGAPSTSTRWSRATKRSTARPSSVERRRATTSAFPAGEEAPGRRSQRGRRLDPPGTPSAESPLSHHGAPASAISRAAPTRRLTRGARRDVRTAVAVRTDVLTCSISCPPAPPVGRQRGTLEPNARRSE
jgi:hypothetical protein